jgi:ligand-binding sensor domain-containing protein
LAVLEDGRWRVCTVADGLIHPSITTVMETRDGVLWVGCGFAGEGGANRLGTDGRFQALTRKDGLAGDKVRQIYEDRRGRLWFCSEYDGAALFSGGARVRLLTTADGLAGQEIKEIIEDQDGAYWLATDRGLSKIANLN